MMRGGAQNFEECVENLSVQGMAAWVPADVPCHGIGHSNGALMHLLIGSLCGSSAASNVIISFNNKEVSDAIPIPGFIDSSRPILDRGRQLGFAFSPQDVRKQWDSLRQSVPSLPSQLGALGPVLSQISSAFTEIESGTVDFDPKPQESRQIIRDLYRVPKTLLLRYSDDAIDETPELTRLLASRPGVARLGLGVREVVLPGTHVTPCGGDLPWTSGPSFSPLDAAVMAGKAIQQQGLRRTARTIVSWLDAAAI